MALIFITIIFLLLYTGLIAFYYKSWLKLTNYSATQSGEKTFISIVVAARNEEAHIPQLLTSLQNQLYPAAYFEIIVVDDFSTDSTAEKVKSFNLQNATLIHPDGDAASSSKKKAIETGVRFAMGELMVATDADCLHQPQWLSTINLFYKKNEAEFIAAPVKLAHDNSLLQIFQSLDFLVLQGITGASVGAGFHSMCNGANLAYIKKAFEEVNAFAGIDKIASGDDMLLMHKIKKQHPKKVFYLKSKEAIVVAEPMKNIAAFMMQRKRWASKTLVYDDWRIIAVLFFVYLFNLLFFILIAASFFNGKYLPVPIAFIILKACIEWRFVLSVAHFFEESKLMKWFLLFQPLHILYTVLIGPISQMGKYEWKGRRMK